MAIVTPSRYLTRTHFVIARSAARSLINLASRRLSDGSYDDGIAIRQRRTRNDR